MLKIKRIESNETTVNTGTNNFTGYSRVVKSKRKALADAMKASDNQLRGNNILVWRA